MKTEVNNPCCLCGATESQRLFERTFSGPLNPDCSLSTSRGRWTNAGRTGGKKNLVVSKEVCTFTHQ